LKLILVSSEPVLCSGLSLWLDQQPDLEVIDTLDFSVASESLVTLLETRPHYLLIECKRIDASVSSLLYQLQQLEYKPLTVVLGARAGSRRIALNAGADAFVYEGDGAKKLLTTIRSLNLDTHYAA